MNTPRKFSYRKAALDDNWRQLRGWARGPWQDVARTKSTDESAAGNARTQRAALHAWEDEGGATAVAPVAKKFGARLRTTPRKPPQAR